MIKKKKTNKIQFSYINNNISKKPQDVIGILYKKKNKNINTKVVKIKRNVAYEDFIQTFPLFNNHKINNINYIN